MRKNIQKIPVDSNFGNVETGPIQFRNDWPGLFISGEDCLELHRTLRYLQDGLEGRHRIDSMPAMLSVLDQTIDDGILKKMNGNDK